MSVQAIDILKLISQVDNKEWNKMLYKAEATLDLNWCLNTRKELQAGMSDLAKKGLNTDKINMLFIRLQLSLEMAGKRIYREKYKNPLYNNMNKNHPDYSIKWTIEKRRLDHEFELILRKTSY